MKKPVWLVTGGAGFIGSNIVEGLLAAGETVRVFDNFSTGKKENLAPFMHKIKLFKGDIRNPAALKKAMKGVAYVSHQAALRSVPKSVDNPVDCNEVNVTGTLNVLMAAKNAGVKRLVYASSSSAYGDSRVFPQVETLQPNPISPYAVAKLAGEHYCMVFARTYRFETVSLRYFNVFGPRQNPESMYSAVIPKFMELAQAGRPLEVHWDGRQSRDFTFVKNVVDANIKAARLPNVAGNVYNIAAGATASLLDIISGLEEILGRKLEKKSLPKRAGDVRKTWADISKAGKELGYKPLVGFKDGLKATWEYFSKLK
ncbi:MAG: SDR family oxidoreductase [Elusimicrobia bacterium]|nr:SDR family oxidoreductase [Elusimicrobiota bacterium]